MLASSPCTRLCTRFGEGALIVGLAAGVSLGSAVAAHAGRATPSAHLAAPATRVAATSTPVAAPSAHDDPPSATATGGAHPHGRPAKARKTAPGHARHAAAEQGRVEAARVLALTKRLRGRPYVWGAAGPRAFDCSGLVQYVFRRAIGKHLPRSTWAQWAAIKHIRRSQLKPGDLVYVRGLWHVGIYAGKGYWWEAPHTGSHVKKRRIWAHHLRFGRVIPRG